MTGECAQHYHIDKFLTLHPIFKVIDFHKLKLDAQMFVLGRNRARIIVTDPRNVLKGIMTMASFMQYNRPMPIRLKAVYYTLSACTGLERPCLHWQHFRHNCTRVRLLLFPSMELKGEDRMAIFERANLGDLLECEEFDGQAAVQFTD